jgi:hypothetical protein
MNRRDFLKASAFAGAALSMGMSESTSLTFDSPLGKQTVDQSGSAIGVVRVDPAKSYSGMGELLQEYLNTFSPGAWDKIRLKIDYTYGNIDLALGSLEAETGFRKEIQSRVEKGQKLFFKPNVVGPRCINPETNGPDIGSTTCTEWAFIAALMRWFHDKLEISYHQMALGEAGTSMPAAAASYSKTNPEGRVITPEAVIEGKVGNFHCGWGFYFARKYLAESLAAEHKDDPMKGYEESVAGIYLPPGRVSDKLMVYDLNRIFDDPSKGREIEVPDGINFKSITLHKAVVGGSAADSKDMRDYPGSILVNVPKFKVHMVTLFTNVIKNLGIGLYPMQSTKKGNRQWDYSVPSNAIPGMKAAIPHAVWVGEVDPETGIPKRDEKGEYVVRKTGGINATMVDIIKAVKNQGIFMVHVVDGIEAINYDHGGQGFGKKEAEGMVFAGLDPVATDLLCARYMFSNVPFKEALGVELDDGHGGRFPQKVPLPVVEGKNIITKMGYDCPISRDLCLKEAEKRGLGVRSYYVVGKDDVVDSSLVSVQGHLGSIGSGAFSDLITKNLYFDIFKFPWDLQQTALHYFSAVDELSGSSLKKNFLEAFDENRDGIVSYEEKGKRGSTDFGGNVGARYNSDMGTNPSASFRNLFIRGSKTLKASDRRWNLQGHDISRDGRYGTTCLTAYNMSKREIEGADPFIADLKWGKGKWPSFQLARYISLGSSLYGNQFPSRITLPSLFGHAFGYADLRQNDGKYVGKNPGRPNPDALNKYFSELKDGKRKPLDFIFYVPEGYETIANAKIANVEVTTDPGKMLTAVFSGGKEIWSAI